MDSRFRNVLFPNQWAKPEVVEENRERLAEAEEAIAKLQSDLQRLESID